MSEENAKGSSGRQQQQKSDPFLFDGVSSAGLAGGALDAVSPAVDVYAVLGVPRPKRPSERSKEEKEEEEEEEEEKAEEVEKEEKKRTQGSDTDDVSDSDDDTDEWQEGEYLVMDEPEDEQKRDVQMAMLSERASHTRRCLLPIFTACCEAYDKWIKEQTLSLSEDEMNSRRQQLQLYKKVLELYGSDAEWEGLTHAQRVNRNQKAHESSVKAKELGRPPASVAEASVAGPQN